MALGLNRGGIVPKPQLLYSYSGQNAGSISTSTGGQSPTSPTLFFVMGLPQPTVVVPPNWQ